MFVRVLINHEHRDSMPHKHECKNCGECSYNAALFAMVIRSNIRRTVC
jgi:hypothetical protein